MLQYRITRAVCFLSRRRANNPQCLLLLPESDLAVSPTVHKGEKGFNGGFRVTTDHGTPVRMRDLSVSRGAWSATSNRQHQIAKSSHALVTPRVAGIPRAESLDLFLFATHERVYEQTQESETFFQWVLNTI
jgi:hypothetical protein